jgi:hypothetical protein
MLCPLFCTGSTRDVSAVVIEVTACGCRCPHYHHELLSLDALCACIGGKGSKAIRD